MIKSKAQKLREFDKLNEQLGLAERLLHLHANEKHAEFVQQFGDAGSRYVVQLWDVLGSLCGIVEVHFHHPGQSTHVTFATLDSLMTIYSDPVRAAATPTHAKMRVALEKCLSYRTNVYRTAINKAQ